MSKNESMGEDPYIVIEGGLIQNFPALPIFDLDVFKSGSLTDYDVQSTVELWRRAMEFPDLHWVRRKCSNFLEVVSPEHPALSDPTLKVYLDEEE